MQDYQTHPAMQGYRVRAFHQGLRAGRRGSHKPAARFRWENRWAGQPEAHCWLDWSDGFDEGARRRE